MHSPFVFDFIINGLETKHPILYKKIEQTRDFYKNDTQLIPKEDYGAGSQMSKKGSKIEAKKMLKNISIAPKYSKLLCNTVTYFKPKNIIELGTAFGVGTMSLGGGNFHEQMVSIEGNKFLSNQAKENLPKMGVKNTHFITGKFDDVLTQELNKMTTIDLAFIDGNHTKEATLRYFHLFKKYAHNDTLLIFDDIYWSEGMTEAWEQIKQDKDVRLTLDFFQLGYVFFRKEQMEQEHFKLWY